MQKDNNNGSYGRAQLLQGAQTLTDQLSQRQLDLIGGEDLRGSGFEGEEPEREYGEEG